ncbi:helix-turn-helix domain-containing protein [Ectobacillus funiculus]
MDQFFCYVHDLRKSVEIISKRWTVLVIHQLFFWSAAFFCAIESALPISGRVLSERLKDLELEGIVKRQVFPETPVRIEYSLTDKGRSLQPVIAELEKWSHDWVKIDETATD